MTITTAAKLRNQAKRLDRRITRAASVLAAMKRGEALHLEHRWHGAFWWLSGGRRLTDDVARTVIADPNVVSVDTALFDGMRPQTWRYAGAE
jgi:hypothetical protein